MTRPIVSQSEGFGVEVAASIDRTLRNEARRNEVAIARVRALVLLVMCVAELVFAVTTDLQLAGAELPVRMLTFVYCTVAFGFWWWLDRGGYGQAVPFLVPLADTVYVLARMQGTFSQVEPGRLAQVQELATIGMTAGVIALTGAFRMSRRAVLLTTGLGIGLYLWFAVQIEVPLEQMFVHAALLGGLGAIGQGLTTIVARAVRSEVARITLKRMLPERILDEMADNPLAFLTQPRSLDATVLITDVRGFTHWAEHRTPMEVLAFLNVVQGILADTVREHGGTVDKFMGDGMLAVFGAPEPAEDHAERAIRAARAMLVAMERLNHEDRLGVEVRIGIGLHSGEVVVGCIGSGIRLEFTVIGDTVNTASRLEQMTKTHGVPVLLSSEVVRRVADASVRRVGSEAIRGRDDPVEVLTLV